jgi:hypothetical protein
VTCRLKSGILELEETSFVSQGSVNMFKGNGYIYIYMRSPIGLLCQLRVITMMEKLVE